MPTKPATDDRKHDASGLRDRKKARRHDEILFHAKALFAERGIDATTMADIAEAAEVSPPTVFNYFANKDGLLIALITEGAQEAMAHDVSLVPRVDSDFATTLIEALTAISAGTLEIAPKRIWRYAEASTIRHPDTDLAREYRCVDRNLLNALKVFLDHYDFALRSAAPADTGFLAELIYTIWNACFLELICDDDSDLNAHRQRLSERLSPLLTMLFEESFMASPRLKTEKS